ncbi:phage portal protein [Streptomyces sp. IBSBF 2435]|uniref:phage portal protein n=1 Tax=Streptomyces sp. IBSBF 2435 TaxID=2903531 RepID=UPI002FDC0DF0
MASAMDDLSDQDWAAYLSRAHDAELPQLQELNAYYEGEQPLKYLHPELEKELGEQMTQLIINWPRLVVDSVEERMDVEGFRHPETEEGDKELWRIWRANGLHVTSQQAHVDGLVMKRGFLALGTNETDATTPRVTAESPLQMYADFDPATREVRAALKRYNDVDPLTGTLLARHATLYRPGKTVFFDSGAPGTWKETDRDEHGIEEPLVVVLPNRARLLLPGGVTELADVLPISDAACKIGTDMMVGSEFHAMPRRWALGFDKDDFVDRDGKPLSVWSRLAGRIWATARTRKEDGAEVGQFPESDLKNFHSTIELLARIVASLGALPPNYLGLLADDAASADAIRSREARLVKRAERKQLPLDGGYGRMNRLVGRLRDGGWDPALAQIETMWRDPATPTYAQKADAVVKLHSAGLLPTEQAWEDLGYTDAQRQRMRQMMDDQATRLSMADLHALTMAPPTPTPDPNPPAPQPALPAAA